MFKSTRLRLTVLYCVIFFSIFWSFSSGLYIWMSNSFGEAYVSKVTEAQIVQTGNHRDANPDPTTSETATIAGDITLGQLRLVLLVLNSALLLLVPAIAWILTERSLRPVRRAYELQRNFVSDASHELRTPLTIMRGELDLALKKKRSNLEYDAALAATRTETVRLQHLVNDLLLLAQSDRSELQFSAVNVDLQETIESAVRRLRPYAREHRISMTVKPSSRLYSLGSQTMLERLFENIVTNAIKFSSAGSSVTIRLEQHAEKAHIYIVDQGRGMSKAAVSRAFDRFYRESESRSDQGTGLGLAISKSIAEQHDGTITIESSLGNGTTVTIIVPLEKST